MRATEAAFPGCGRWDDQDAEGLSKREWFAGLAMQGILASGMTDRALPPLKPTEIAEGARNIADALLAELSK